MNKTSNPFIPARFPATASDQTLYLDRTSDDGQIRAVLTLRGRLDPPRLARAVRLSLDAEPVLGCRFVEQRWRPYWERIDLDRVPLLSCIQPQDCAREINHFLAAPIESRVGPLVRACLFQGDDDTLCVKIHHAVSDGGGLKEYIELLARIYRALRQNPDYAPTPNVRGNRRPSQAVRGVGLRALWRSLRGISLPDSRWSLPQTFAMPEDLAFVARSADDARCARIKAYARAQHVPVSDVLLTAFYRALVVAFNPPRGSEMPVTVTRDLRYALPTRRAGGICNLSAAIFPLLKDSRGATFQETLAHVHSTLAQVGAARPEFAELVLLDLAFVGGFGLGRRFVQGTPKPPSGISKFNPTFSNGGMINLHHMNFGDAQVSNLVAYGPAPFKPDLILAVTIVPNRINLATCFFASTMDARLVENFFDAFSSELPA